MTDLLTFLQTDLVGSTRHWVREPDAMRVDLERHDQLLVELITAHEGHIFKHTGDGILAHFDDLHAACRASVAIQEAIAREPWRVQGGLQARIGVLQGQAFERAGDFYGPALNALARLTDLPSGGQSLLAVREDPASPSLRALGNVRLSEGEAPWLLFQIVREGEPTFARLRAAHVPAIPSSFLGREEELDELQARWEHGGAVLSLVGPGGCGKTRIAIELLDRLPVESIWVSLASTEVPVSLESAVWRVLMDDAPEPEDLAEAIGKQLDERPLQVVFDSAEHHLDALADFVTRHQRRTRFLITSREPVGVEGEEVVRVGPLRHEEAVQLFRARAAAVAGWIEDPSYRQAVEDLVRKLEGIPLAIELAASRLRSMSLPDLQARLSDRFRALTGGTRGRPERHQTLERTMDWSYEMLSADEKRLLMAAGLMPSAFSLEMLEGWVEMDDLEEVLVSLVDKSWILFEPRTRPYRMLDTLRDYTRLKRKEAGLEDSLRWAHAEWSLNEARSLRQVMLSPQADEATGRLRGMVPSLTLAADTLLSARKSQETAEILRVIWRYWYRSGRVREGLRELRTFWERMPEVPTTPEELDARRSWGWALYLSGFTQEALKPAREALEGAQAIGSIFDESQARGLLAGALLAAGQVREAIHEYRRALDGLVGEENAVARARIQTNIGASYLLMGAYEDALQDLNEAETVVRSVGDEWATAWILLSQAQAYRCLKVRQRAWDLFQESLEIRTRLGDERGVAYAELGLAHWFLDEGLIDDARTHWIQGARRSLKIEDPWAMDASMLVAGRLWVAEKGAEHPETRALLDYLTADAQRVRFVRTEEDRAFLEAHQRPGIKPLVPESCDQVLRRYLEHTGA